MNTELPVFKINTDVQKTWREHGWKPPSEDPAIVAKWQFFQTLIIRGDTQTVEKQ